MVAVVMKMGGDGGADALTRTDDDDPALLGAHAHRLSVASVVTPNNAE